jgi:tetratricopeptide (TPR) repeat protein
MTTLIDDAAAAARPAAAPRRTAAALADVRGCPVGTGSVRALEHAEKGLWRMVSYYGNALDDLDAAIAEDPTWVLAHVMKANALLSMTEHGLGLLAADSLQRATELAAAGQANDRERRHLAATQACAAGQWQQACEAWERILLDHPQDLVALQIAHLFDFYRGDARNLHRRVARVLPEWSPRAPLYGFVLGMHAFGLEECNLYPHALDAGLAALALDARDPWAVHAVTHVHEMQGRFDEGARFLASRSGDWSPDNGFAYHNWWHLALFHLERSDAAAALALLDERVMPGAEYALQRIDISALLWRLRLMGVDVGERFAACAALWPAAPEAGHYAFNDLHAVLALVGAGRLDDAALVLEAARARSREASTVGAMAADIGVPLMTGVLDYGRGRYAEAVEALGSVRDVCHRFGGSHAQRDLVQLTTIGAAIASGNGRLARALASERTEVKPTSPLNWRLMARALEAQGATTEAKKASEHAELRRRAQLRRTAA